ncbi:ABC transporter permease [Candidatus Woesearchaeota archaeon]|nr:ABC transporter permease [Candidatus Woesearchaeota archaeon]
MITDFIRLGINNLTHRKLRAILTIIGIVIGIAAIVSLISISDGLENAIVDQFEKMGIKRIRVVPKGLMGPPVGVEGLTTKDVELIEKIKGVDYVTPVLMQNAKIRYGTQEDYKPINAYPVEEAEQRFLDMDIKFYEGRSFREGEKDYAIVGYKTAKDLFDKEIRAKNSIYIEGRKFRVIGIFEKQGVPHIDSSVYIPLDVGREIFNKPEEVSVITVEVKKGKNMDEVARTIKQKLKRERNDEEFEVFTPQQILNQLGVILGMVQFILAGIAAISLIVGAIGIMNVMFTSVLERTREIGVMKATGASNESVLMIFIIESGLLGLSGGAVGATLGAIFALIVGAIAEALGFPLLLIRIQWQLILSVLAFAFLLGIFSGTLPALKAAKMKPVDSLRYE